MNKDKFRKQKEMIKVKYPVYLLVILAFFSCRSSQELVYMKDFSNQEIIKHLPLEDTEHLLKTGDILYVSIKSMNPEVNQVFNPESVMENGGVNSFQKYTTPNGAYLYGYEINGDGFITLPIIGDVNVEGVPLSKVKDVVQKKANEYVKDAIVNVKLLNFKVTVVGEVKSPGVFYNYNNTLTVLEAIAMANGNTDYASLQNIVVIRPIEDGSKTYKLNLGSKEVFNSEAFYLKPNDYVIIQPDKHKNLQLNSQLFSLSLSTVSTTIAILALILNLR